MQLQSIDYYLFSPNSEEHYSVHTPICPPSLNSLGLSVEQELSRTKKQLLYSQLTREETWLERIKSNYPESYLRLMYVAEPKSSFTLQPRYRLTHVSKFRGWILGDNARPINQKSICQGSAGRIYTDSVGSKVSYISRYLGKRSGSVWPVDSCQ